MADVITRLKLESGEYDSKIKRAAQGLQRMEEECRKVGGTLANLEKDQLDFVKGLGNMETVSKSARGRLGELTTAFTDLRAQYNRLTQEEKQGDFGKALNTSLERLKVRIQDTKQELNSINQEMNGSKFGQFGGMIDSLGQKMGLNVNITELLTSKTAMMTAGIGAATAIVGKATQEWAKYNTELAKQDQITTVTTGLKGADSDRMTDQARSLTDTYGVDFREAINAANTLMTQFGQTGEQAMSLIRDGMQGMIQGDGPKLLSMIQQYAPAFRDAGVTASQLVAVIQNSEGGIFTDQNMNAIVMGIKNIRLMTKATSDALAQLGIDGQKMSQQLRDGSMTIFDALKQVATQIQGVNSGSQAAGEVMQQVFGRQGAMAGTKLGEAIATLNTNLEETKRQTGEVGDAYNDLYNANVKLNGAIRDCFEYDGWDQMATGIKANLVSALASVLDYLGKIKGALGGFSVGQQQGDTRNGGGQFIDRAVDRLRGGNTPGKQQIYTRQVHAYSGKILDINDQIRQIQEKAAQDMDGNMAVVYEKQIRNLENRKQAIQRNMAEYDKRAQAVLNGMDMTPAPVINPITNTTQKGGSKGGGSRGGSDKTEEQQNAASIAELVKQYQDLATAAKVADDAQKTGLAERMAKIQGEIKTLQDRNTELKKFADEARQVQYPVGSLPQLNEQMKTLQTEQSKALDAKQWQDYQRQIEQTQYQIDALKGKWQDGLQATFKLNIEQQGSTDINTAKPDDITVTFRADDSDVLAKVRDIEGIAINDKTMTVTAQTQEAIAALQRVDGLTLQPKAAEVTFKADDSDVLAKVRDIEGVTIDPKTLTVTANTVDAYNQVQQLLESVDGKTVTFTVQPKMETGTSIQNDAGIQGYIASIKQQLETADYGTSLYNGLSAQLADMTTLQNLVGVSLKAGLGTAMFEAADATGKDFWTRAMEGGVENTEWQPIVEKINEALKAAGLSTIKLDFTTGSVSSSSTDGQKKNPYLSRNEDGKQELKLNDAVSGIAGGIQNMVGSLQSLGVELPKGLTDVLGGIQAVTSLLSAIMSIVTVIQAITAADAVIPFAGGGIVPRFAGGGLIGKAALGMTIPGHSYSGDLLRLPVDGGRGMIGVNSGEVILNQAQAGILESELSGSRMRDIKVYGEIQGENIILSANRYLRRTGQGELVTWGL